MQKNQGNNSGVALRAGVWYIVCNFIDKGFVFLTTPIFTRLLTKSVIGDFSNYTVWLTLVTYVVTMDMHVTISRARFDYKDNLNQYISSIAILSFLSTCTFSVAILLFHEPILNFMGIDIRMLFIMMSTIAFSGSFQMFQIEHRVHYKYKTFTMMTLLVSVSTIVLSLILIKVMPDQLMGRVFGYTIPRWLIYLALFILLIYKGRCFKWGYCKYCLKICMPYIPHLLSLYILSASDKAMIKMFQGSEEVALYSIGYTCSMVVMLLGNSMNQAWSPWLTERLHEGSFQAIRKWSTRYFALFMLLVTAVGFIAPEMLLFMGGKSYASAVYVIPPVMAGCIFQFAYTMYVNIETYEKKTGRMALATMTGALVNVILNYIFIPKHGYVAAAFTTLVGYGILFFVHFLTVKKLKMTHVYSSKFVFGMLLFSSLMIFVYYFLYQHFVLRMMAIGVVAVILIVLAIKNKDVLYKVVQSVIPREMRS